MARIRSIKPEFFTDEDIAKLPPLYRIAFSGLWCHADKAGRLRDRPARLKVQILPYDDVNFGEVLDALVAARFVQRYQGPDGMAYLQVRTFGKHQRPRPDEPESECPAPPTSLFSDGPVTPQSIGKEGKGKELKEEGNTPLRVSALDIVSLWNQLVTPPIPQVTKLTTDRKAKIDARLKTVPDLASWRTAISWANGQDWMRAPGTGQHPNWTVTLDWLCKNDGNLIRCVERAHAERPADAPHADMNGHFPHCNNTRDCRDRYLREERAKKAAQC